MDGTEDYNERFKHGVMRAMREQPVSNLYSFLINQGRAFTMSHRIEDVGNEDSIYSYLQNPSESGFDYDIVLLPRSTGLSDFDISTDATEGTAGDVGVMRNLRDASEREFSGHSRLATTGDDGTLPTHGDTYLEDFVPGTGRGVNIGGQVIDAISFTIASGSDKLIELHNVSGGGVDRMALNVIAFEVDGTFKETEST